MSGHDHLRAVIRAAGARFCRCRVTRNAGREGKAKVPPVAIYVTRKKLQPPTHSEGFDQPYSVRIAEDGAFQIQPWVEEALDV